MTSRWGLDAAVFSLKSYAAAMLAVYVALSIRLERPYWAFLTAYIVAQPLAGAVLSKALFRVVGTFAGAVVAVAIVPPLVQSPELMTLAIAAWLALCCFVSLLDRTPRAYMFVLAGYTAVVIALPTFEHPGTIFTVAALRVQEIMLGILCGSLVHGVVLPGSVSDFLAARVTTTLKDAERWTHDSLGPESREAIERERLRIALDVTEMHQLSIHLPYETRGLAPRIRTVRALQDQLSLLLPLGAAVADRIAVLGAAGLSAAPGLDKLLADTRAWIAGLPGKRAEREAGAGSLIERCAALEPGITRASDWQSLLRLSLLARLAALIATHRDCRDLAEQMTSPSRQPVNVRVAELLERRRNRELHIDLGGAVRGALGAFLTMIIGSALWIASGWADGSSAVMLAGVFLALFCGQPDPLVLLRAFLWGTLIATLMGGIYGFAILPRLDGFAEFAAAFAPPLLVLGALMYSPRYYGIALPTLLGMGSPLLVANRYSGDFASFANGSLAQLVGIFFAIVMVKLLQSAGAEAAVRRTLRAGWRDIAERSNLTVAPDVRGWVNRMLDRIAILAPRVASTGRDPGEVVVQALRDMRTGVAIGELRQLRIDLPARDAPLAPLLGEVLGEVGALYRQRSAGEEPSGQPALLADIDKSLVSFLAADDRDVRRRAAIGLVSLRRALFPEAPPIASTAA